MGCVGLGRCGGRSVRSEQGRSMLTVVNYVVDVVLRIIDSGRWAAYTMIDDVYLCKNYV